MTRRGIATRASRLGFLALGLLCVGLGFVGIAVPGMPSTVFFILALWAFERSSPHLERWLLSNRYVGPTLRNWREHRAMTVKAKAWATVLLWVCIGISLALVHSLFVAILLVLVAGALTWFFLTRKTARPVAPVRA